VAGASLLAQVPSMAQQFLLRSEATAVKAIVKDENGESLALTAQSIPGAALVPNREDGGWHLKVMHDGVRSTTKIQTKRTINSVHLESTFSGSTAQRALSVILPHINKAGGSARQVRAAVGEIAASKQLDALIREAATRRQFTNNVPGQNLLAGMPAETRLALEMVLHNDDERRALEGEMQELEQRWLEAEEIASISDSLLLPPGIEERLAALRTRSRSA
jgi:hypothetical protein